MISIVDAVVENAKKKHDFCGNAVYIFEVQKILDAGFDLAELRENVKRFRGRFVQNESKIRLQSANLRADLNQILVKPDCE